jgi:preprotein translocase subunit SecE
MSAPRRTPTKQQTGSAATVASRPAAPAAPTPAAAPARPSRPPVDKGKSVQPTQPSVVAVRIEAVRRLARDTWSEMKKVNWPDRETTRNLTIIGISVVLGLLLGGIDYILVQLLGVF